MLNFKYCPRCASKKLYWPSQKNFECAACNFTYYHNQAAAACVILRYKEEILLIVRGKNPAKGFWALPGGFVDPDETALSAATRELKEEISLRLEPNQLIYFDTAPNTYDYKDVLYKTLDIAFRVNLSTKAKTEIGDQEEIKEIFWIHPKEIPLEEIAFESTQNILKKYITLYCK